MTGTHSRPPKDDETAIEAPFRLVISPSDEARWAHVTEPAGGKDAKKHVELWHSRLGNLGLRADGSAFTDEKNAGRRIIRAVWARDRDRMSPGDWRNPKSGLPLPDDNDPFQDVARRGGSPHAGAGSPPRPCASDGRTSRRFPWPLVRCGYRAWAPGWICTAPGTRCRTPVVQSARSSGGITLRPWAAINSCV